MTLNGNLLKINKLKFKEKKLVVATHNNGKLNEIKDLLKINKIPVEILDTRYMGHFLWKIAKLHYKKNVIK